MKKFVVLFVATFTLSFTVNAVEQKAPVKKYTQEKWNKEMKDREKDSWVVDFKLDAPGLCSGVVLFALVDKDPVEYFKADLKKSKQFLLETADLEDNRHRAVQSSWNSVFETVSGRDVFYLENIATNKHAPSHSHGSNRSGKLWLVTKAMGCHDENMCWSIPLKVKKGKTIEVKLTDKNMVSNEKLEKIYDSIVK